ncbi:MGF-360-10L-like protein K49-1010 [African swine fever virus]|nr:MGF-360-10L-like protein K49-1010 [African swine fever virus]
MSHRLSLDIYSPDSSLLTLKEADPNKIYRLLKTINQKVCWPI